MIDSQGVPELSVMQGRGPRLRKRSPAERMALRRKARRRQQETVVALSDFIARPLPYGWEDARCGKQRWWGNLLAHAEELVNSDTPPSFDQLLMIAEVLAWHIMDLCAERGIPVDLPDPPTPMQIALVRRRAA